MESNRLWELAGRKITGEATEEEVIELYQLAEKHPEALFMLETMGYYWHAAEDMIAEEQREEALAKHMDRLRENIDVNVDPFAGNVRSLNRRRRQWIAAASLAGLLLVAGSMYRLLHITKAGNEQIQVSSLEKKNYTVLPDGSKVWLNAGSTLSYAKGFLKSRNREVTLSGEGFFEIRHDAEHPFRIHTEKMDIRDIGTRFNVRAYPSDKTTEATLIEGSIEVILNDGSGSAVLSKPHEKMVAYNKTVVNGASGIYNDSMAASSFSVIRTTVSSSDSLLAETAWMNNMLVFRDEPFAELAIRMERWYNVRIRFNRAAIQQYRFTGMFKEETIEQALHELQLIRKFQVTRNNGNIIID